MQIRLDVAQLDVEEHWLWNGHGIKSKEEFS